MGFPNMAAWAAKKGKKQQAKEPAEVDASAHSVDKPEAGTCPDCGEDMADCTCAKAPGKKPAAGGFAAFIKRKRVG